MIRAYYTVVSNEKLTENVYKMVLSGETNAITAPGQFINIKLSGLFLRRPISIYDWDDKTLTIIYKVVGEGTEQMSDIKAGEKLDCLVALGNGFDTSVSGERPVLIGGGVGIPPMYGLAKKLIAEGKKPQVILGFNKESEIFAYNEFCAICDDVYVTTVDGSVGTYGFVTDVLKNLDYTYFYTCGPMPMFCAIETTAKGSGQFSFEERMGCGFGACMGCTCKTKYGNKRICKDGPVLVREEIIW